MSRLQDATRVMRQGRRRFSICLALAVALALAGTTLLSAQDTVTVSGEVSCAGCRITWDTVVTIGGLDGPGLDPVMAYSRVAVDSLGRILIGVYSIPEISVFDSTGTFIQTIGGRGEGPGEYQIFGHIDAGPQYIHVFDMRGRTMLDYDLEFVRMDRFPRQFTHSYIIDSDDIAFVGDLPTEASVGHRLHILRRSGEIESYGGDGSVYRGPRSSNVSLIAGDAETSWVVESRANRLTRWDLVPKPAVGKVFDRKVEEFDRHDPDLYPNSHNIGVMLDGSGLWVLWEAPDPAWKTRIGGGQDLPDALRRRVVDSHLDLVDPVTGRTLARARFDGRMSGFAYGSRYLVAFHETEAGVPYVHLLDPHVSGLTDRRQFEQPRPVPGGIP